MGTITGRLHSVSCRTLALLLHGNLSLSLECVCVCVFARGHIETSDIWFAFCVPMF